MKLLVEFCERSSCYAALHSSDATEIFKAGLTQTRHFCRALRVQCTGRDDAFVGWIGDQCLSPGVMQMAKPFAECLGFEEGEQIEVFSHSAPLARSVMVQPNSIDDFEVVELQATFIEENLLKQVSVLMPGMAFPVWVHGLVAMLRVDPADANTSPCFMLGLDTELAIESRRRSEGVPISSGSGGENCFHLRVFALLEEIVIPQALVQEKDLDSLASGLSSCLTWLDMSRSKTLRPSEDMQLLQLVVSDKVPRGHIILGATFANCLHVPCFGLVKLWRCLQVPAYVPRVELVPRLRSAEGVWEMGSLRRRFEALVKAHGEIEVADGAPLLLRPEKLASKDSPATSVPDAGTSGSEVDLYEGLSDISDIYQRQVEPAICADDDCGVYEVDLGLDLASPSFPSSVRLEKEPLETQAVLVYIRLAVGAARDFRTNGAKPPFTRLSAESLAGGEPAVAVSMDRYQETVDSEWSKQDLEPLGLLWARAPRPPPEDWPGVLQLVPPFSARAVDEMTMFSQPAEQLRRLVEACLGKSGANASKSILDCAGRSSIRTPGMIAITGPPGSGKTRLASRVLSQLASQGVLPLQVICRKLGQPGKKFRVIQDWLRAILSFACWYSPCAVLLDDFGALCPDVEPGAPNLSVTEERSPLIAEMLLDLLPEVRSSGAQVALVATMPDDAAVHRMLWSWPALEHKVGIRQPELKERPEMLMALLREKEDEGWEVEHGLLAEGALDDRGGRVDGFSVADLVSLVERSCVEATVEASATRLRGGDGHGPEWGERQRLTMDHLEKACEGFVPATMADQTFFTSEVNLTDIGGLNSAKEELMDMLTMPTKYAVLLDRAPVRTRKGLMLVGPPGCGKTMLVQAAAKETKGLLRFLSVKGPELLSKYIGESEAGVRKVFERAAAAAPAVIFFDEIEALAPKRGADSTGVTDRVVNQMLCYLDGVEDRGRVFVVAATGRPDMVDPALMRPGRFDKICYCGLPSDDEKLEICQVLARKNDLVGDVQVNGNAPADLTVSLRQLVSRLPRLFTSADISALFSSAKIEAVNETLQKDGPKEPKMRMSHLYAALATSKASVSEADERRYAQIFAPYCGGSGSRGALDQETKSVKVALA